MGVSVNISQFRRAESSQLLFMLLQSRVIYGFVAHVLSLYYDIIKCGAYALTCCFGQKRQHHLCSHCVTAFGSILSSSPGT